MYPHRNNEKFKEFRHGYITAIFFTDVIEDHPDLTGLEDLHKSALDQINIDLDYLWSHYGHMIETNPSQVGHDFWLTRNGHGSGFWDRSDDAYKNSVFRDNLNRIAQNMREQSVEVINNVIFI